MTNLVQKPAKAIIFAKVSSENQADGHSLEAQVYRAQEYCKRNGLEVIQEFRIAESSGRSEQFSKVIDYIGKQKEQIALVVDSVDRLQRSFKECSLIDDLRKSKALEIHFCKENFILSDSSSSSVIMRWDFGILGARMYVAGISDNVKRGIQLKLEKGECIGHAPIGYKNVRNEKYEANVIIDAEKAPLIKKMFEMYSLGTHPLGDLEKFAQQNNLTNNFFFRSEGEPITKNVISCFLQNPFYYGEMYVKSHNKHYPHKYETIITKELFNKCQEVRRLRAKR